MMRRSALKYIHIMLITVLLSSWPAFSFADTAGDKLQSSVDSGRLNKNVLKQVELSGTTEAIVILDSIDANTTAGRMRGLLGIRNNNDDIIKARAEHHKKKKDDLLAAIRDTNHKVKEDFGLLPVMHLKVDKATLAKLLDMPSVAYVGENSSFAPKLSESLPLISTTQVQGSGFGGSGTSVAVLDSSINYTLSAFGGCTSPGTPSGCKVAYVQDFVSEGGSLTDTSHGTNVSGIIVGVAPDAKVLGLNVYRADGLAYENDVIRALQWVLSNRTTYNIVAVNISFGVGKYSAPCTNSPLAGVIGDLTSAGIAVTVASGNDGYSDALSYPACVPGAISVGAVYDATIGSNRFWQGANCTDAMTLSDQVACFSNSASFLAMLAPGSEINAANIPMSGTSQAAPHVAGAVALLKSKEPQLTVDDVIARLTATGAPVIDIRNGTSKPRLDVSSALSSTQSAASGGQGQPLGNGNQPEKANPENGDTPQNTANQANGNNDTATDTGDTALNQGGSKKAASKIAGPGWHMAIGEPVTHGQTTAHINNRSKRIKVDKVKKPATMSTMGVLPGKAIPGYDYSPEIMELARALQYDPLQIYDYVHNKIDYVPYFGHKKGATLTYLDGRGNDFDQASLMVSLLRNSGYTAQYVYGTMWMNASFLANWLGVDLQADVIDFKLYAGGIPATVYADGSATVTRVWVKATINNVNYNFDPSYKRYGEYTSQINIGSALGYSQGDFLASATSGATVTGDYIQNVNEGNIRNKLTSYSMNLVNTIRSQYPNKNVDEIIGGRYIDEVTTTILANQLTFNQVVTSEIWDEIPQGYSPTMRIRHAGIDVTFKSPDLEGGRLTMTYAGSNNHPELRLDGVLQMSGSGTTLGNFNDYTITITHPVAAYNGDYGSQEVTSKMKSGSSYAMLYTFDDVSETLLQKRQRLLDGYMAQGLSNPSEAVRGETLNIMGMTWMKEYNMENRLLSGISGYSGSVLHMFGIMAQENGYYVSIEGIMGTTSSRHNSYDMASIWKQNLAGALIGSGLEHGVLEQLMGANRPGVSTVKGLQVANASGRKVFRTTSANFASVRPQLVGYTAAQLNNFSNLVSNGCTITLPDYGQLTLGQGQWTGDVHISLCYPDVPPHTGFIVSNSLHGGVSAFTGDVEPTTVSGNTAPAQDNIYCSSTISPVNTSTCRDPVDMASGAYLFDSTDLSLGGIAPLGLSFTRSYTSSRNQTKRTMGYGWSHNNDVYLTPISDANSVMGMRQPVDAASFIAALYVIYDLMKNQDNVTGWMAASLASKWAMDQTINNAVTVQAGRKTMEFVQLADGSYSSPPGITTKLIKNSDGTFNMQERFGMRTDFDSNKRIAKITDVDGNYTIFHCNGDKLSTVTDAMGRTLTLEYDISGRVKQVSDSTGRFVTYGYDANGDLTVYTDPENKNWGHGYNGHLMLTMTNPLQINSVTNIYDSLNKVKSQIEPRQAETTATYNYYFSGYKNMLEDPNGQLTTFFYDAKGREYKQINALGEENTKLFDGQDHVIKKIGPRSSPQEYGSYQMTGYSYDGKHNLITEATDPVIWSNVDAYTITNTYDPQNRLTDITDYNGHTTHYGYDSRHHLTLVRDGAGNATQASYNAPFSLRDTATDGMGTVTIFTYDSYGNPQTKKTGSHPQITYTYDPIGRLTGLTDQTGSLTTFEYDKRGLLTRTIDPSRVNATTFDYYDDGKLWHKTDRNGNTITYSYTPSGKIEQISYPGGTPVSFTYNNLDQLQNMSDSVGVTNYTYDAVGRISSFTNPFGFTVSYIYDIFGNVKELVYPDGKRLQYAYDRQDRISYVNIQWLPTPPHYYRYKNYEKGPVTDTSSSFAGLTHSFTFDADHRLTDLNNWWSTFHATLDANGNKTSVTQYGTLSPVPGTSNTYSYNSTNNRLLSDGANSFGYDSEGQLSSGYGSSYSFDYEHRLTGISGVAHYAYDGAGNRLQAVRNGVVTRYIYDASGNLIAEADGNNTITRYYIYGYGLLGMALPDGTVYEYEFDPSGNTVAVANSNNSSLANQYAYDPFGGSLNQSETIAQPFKFVGQYGVMAEPNGLYYMKARYYDPKVGRFISEDPLGFDGGDVNLSAYVQNNPVNNIDPSGLYWFRQSWQEPGVVGRPGTTVPPGGPISQFIEKYVPAGYTFGETHDGFVDVATRAGIPDVLANIPSMIPMLGIAIGTEALRTLGILNQPAPKEKSTPCK